MTDQDHSLEVLQQKEQQQQQTVNRLQRMIFVMGNNSPETRESLQAAQTELFKTQKEITEKQALPPPSLVESGLQEKGVVYRGGQPSGLPTPAPAPADPRAQIVIGRSGVGVSVRLQMEYLPTAIYHLFDSEAQPLLECAIATDSRMKRFLRVSSYIEGYSAQDVCTLELEKKDDIKIIKHLPALFSERIRSVSELTRAMLNVKIEDLESGKVIEHRALPLWLLARNSAPLAVKNPTTGKWDDLSHYYAAFVTPNQEDVMSFLRQAVELQTKRKFVGYVPEQPVRPQVEALYNALQQKAGILYVNSIINFNLDESASSQRVRLPRETLKDKLANCIDGVLLFASLLEAISLNPAIVLIPGHALLAWETGEGNNRWEYLETTMLGDDKTFDEACEHASGMAELSEKQQEAATQAGRGEELWFRRLSLHELRTKRRITPME